MSVRKDFKFALILTDAASYYYAPRDGQYLDTCIGDTYRAILLYRYRYRFSTSPVSI